MTDRDVRRQDLVRLFNGIARTDDHLYNSNLSGDGRPSITVSAVALQVLAESAEPTADLVYKGISSSLRPGRDGPWLSQGGGLPHTVSASWAIFAGSRARLDALEDFAPAVVWLLDLQDLDGAWPHARGGGQRVFQTGLALNAVLSYQDRLNLGLVIPEGIRSERIEAAIELGMAWLTKKALSPCSSAYWFWGQQPRARTGCLASTSICLHVMLKASNQERFAYLRSPVCMALAAIARAFEPGALKQSTLSLEGVTSPLETWPQVAENEPAYWYSYFTPLLAVTFQDAIDGDVQNASAYHAAIVECERWIVEDYDPSSESSRARGVWAIANALLVLNRCTAAVQQTLSPSGTFRVDLLQTAPPWSDTGDFDILCSAIDGSLSQRITTPATDEQRWSQLVEACCHDSTKLLKLFSVVAERYPSSDAGRRILQRLKEL